MEILILLVFFIPAGVFVLMFMFKIYDCCNEVIQTCQAINAFLEKEHPPSQQDENRHIDIEEI